MVMLRLFFHSLLLLVGWSLLTAGGVPCILPGLALLLHSAVDICFDLARLFGGDLETD